MKYLLILTLLAGCTSGLVPKFKPGDCVTVPYIHRIPYKIVHTTSTDYILIMYSPWRKTWDAISDPVTSFEYGNKFLNK